MKFTHHTIAVTLFTLSAFTNMVHAAPMLQGPSNAVTGISGLEIDGTTYDVTFSNSGSFDSRSEMPLTFLSNPDGAEAATAAIQGVLNNTASGVTNLSEQFVNLIITPFQTLLDANNVPSYQGFGIIQSPAAGSLIWAAFQTQEFRANEFINHSFTSFTQVTAPAAVFMFAPALLGLLGLRRKKRAA